MNTENTPTKHAERVQLPNSRGALLTRAAAGLGMTVSEFINKTLGATLPEPQTDKQPA